LGKHWKPFATAALAKEQFESHTRALLLSSLATAAPRVAESVEEFNKEIERRQKVGAGKAADTAEALKTERIRLEKLEKLNREGSPTLTELELKELIKQVEERYKYTLSTRNIASCFCIKKLRDIVKFCQLPISPNLLPVVLNLWLMIWVISFAMTKLLYSSALPIVLLCGYRMRMWLVVLAWPVLLRRPRKARARSWSSTSKPRVGCIV